jgi:O-antigen ligase
MRTAVIYLGTLFLAGYAVRDWYKSVCGLIIMTAVLDNPNMPREMFGIGGLNPWNLLFFVVVPAWLVSRRREGLKWDMPWHMNLLLLLYVGVILVGFARLLLDRGPITASTGELVREYLLNTLKYIVPGLLLFDGARDRTRFVLGMASLLAVYVVVALLVIKWMPLTAASGGEYFQARAMRRLHEEIGIHRTALSVMLAGACWAMLGVRSLADRRSVRLGLLGVVAIVFFAQALTAGRGGYLASACVGLVLCLLRWRKYLLVAPLAVAAVLSLVPGVRERALTGIKADSEGAEDAVDEETLSAGRLSVWPYMLAKVWEAPIVGFGRLGYQRSGLAAYIAEEIDPTFPHPHNAYLEWLLDNGWLGLALVAPFYLAVLGYALVLFTDSSHPMYVAAGAAAFALVFSQLVGGMTGRSWYPDAETLGMWCAIGLMMRVWVERARVREAT